MTITEHLDLIEKLVLDRAAPAEIRRHIAVIREQVEAYDKQAASHSEREHLIQQLQNENADLQRRLAPPQEETPDDRRAA